MNVRALPILITVLSGLALAGCASTDPIEISASPIDKPTLMVPKVSKLNMRDVKWVVVNKENFAEIMADIEKKNGNVVLFAVTDKGYEALSLNIADLRQLVQQQQSIIAAYEKYYQVTPETPAPEVQQDSWFRWGE